MNISKSEIIKNCEKIRDLLSNNGFPILKNVKIFEMFENEKKTSFCCGYAKTNLQKEKQFVINKTIYIPVVPESIKIRLKKDGKYINFINVIPTLIHEFGHCIANVEHDMEKRETLFHGDEFYNSFAKLMQVAEKIGIYRLNCFKSNKFDLNNLKKLDRFDLISHSMISIGSSNLFQEKKNKIKITLNIQNIGKKLIICERANITEIEKMIQSKIGNNIKYHCTNIDGEEIDLKNICEDCEINIYSSPS
jgi:hypothetical protein